MPRLLPDPATIDLIERALVEADAFVLTSGEGLRTTVSSPLGNPLRDCPLRALIAEALIGMGTIRVMVGRLT